MAMKGANIATAVLALLLAAATSAAASRHLTQFNLNDIKPDQLAQLAGSVPPDLLANVDLNNLPSSLPANLDPASLPDDLKSKIPANFTLEDMQGLESNLPSGVSLDDLKALSAAEAPDAAEAAEGPEAAAAPKPSFRIPEVPKLPNLSGFTLPPMPSNDKPVLPPIPDNVNILGFDIAVPNFISNMFGGQDEQSQQP